jgi:hypothetical protein
MVGDTDTVEVNGANSRWKYTELKNVGFFVPVLQIQICFDWRLGPNQ